jgi:hypothetical protein
MSAFVEDRILEALGGGALAVKKPGGLQAEIGQHFTF